MDTLQCMRVFVNVVEAGSFTAAANSTNVTTAHVSRAISELEGRLQTRLLNRTTRRIALTEAGERYLQRCTQILAEVMKAEAEAGFAHARPIGKLRLHAPTGFGQHYVVRSIGEYQKRYPEVQIQLTLGQRVPDLLEEGFDVALVAALALSDSGLVSQHIGSAFSIVCASPAYLSSHGVPRSPKDLVNHRCVHLRTPVFPVANWTFNGPDGEETINLGTTMLEVNTTGALAEAVREGLGIGLMPFYSAVSGLKDGHLAWILPAYRSQQMNLYALYASRQYVDAKIRTWVDFLRESMPATLLSDQEQVKEFAI
jgi:DNA-binding transcriptional LysR family regulator